MIGLLDSTVDDWRRAPDWIGGEEGSPDHSLKIHQRREEHIIYLIGEKSRARRFDGGFDRRFDGGRARRKNKLKSRGRKNKSKRCADSSKFRELGLN